MKFIGRKNELHKLDTEYNRDSSFVVIYGDAVLEIQH